MFAVFTSVRVIAPSSILDKVTESGPVIAKVIASTAVPAALISSKDAISKVPPF